ncbi:MAG: MFS transporter [Anaerolineales bacterium]|nr:MFS transporter [Anaerolineales bacterium]
MLTRRTPLALIFFTVFVDLLGYGMIAPLLPFYARAYSGGAALAGGLRSLYAGLQLLAGPILGALSDKYGRRPVILLCMLGTAVAYLLFGLATSWEWLVLAVTLDGLTGANLTTAQAYLADSTSEDERARGFGLIGAAIGLGMMAGPALGGVLSVYGLSVPAYVAAALAFSNVLFGFFALPESLPAERRAASVNLALNPFTPLMGLWKLIPARAALLAVFLLNLVFNGLQTSFPLYSQFRFGWDAYLNGWLFAFVGVCAVITQGVLVARWEPKVGAARLALIGLVVMTVSVAAIPLIGAAGWLYPLVSGAALGSGLAIPTLSGLISRAVPAQEQGRLLGGLHVLLGLAMIVGPALSGVAYEALGPELLPWLGAALCGVAAGVFFGRGRTRSDTDA